MRAVLPPMLVCTTMRSVCRPVTPVSCGSPAVAIAVPHVLVQPESAFPAAFAVPPGRAVSTPQTAVATAAARRNRPGVVLPPRRTGRLIRSVSFSSHTCTENRWGRQH
ncbi:hypothetical protein GCM10010507_55410 [Streptomyces cinnamoneus]|uniref:Uncharacterized protein n=1 Tax=Streptomyces cinnamoneus TaxID=53446 RepID=A0A918WQS5_STRCJ|nr:hypothetical protein GCM10010507_55410 [Streptomyces cinnamoneus]